MARNHNTTASGNRFDDALVRTFGTRIDCCSVLVKQEQRFGTQDSEHPLAAI